MKKILTAAIGLSCLFYALAAFAALFIWQDEKGAYRLSDKLTQLPKEYQDLAGDKLEQKKEAKGIGYWRDNRGNYHFYRVAPAAPPNQRQTPAPPAQKPAYDPLLDNAWKGAPNPEVWTKRVSKVVAADELLLDGGETLVFTGVAFPEELKRDCAAHQEARAYLQKLLEGKTVKILFDRKKQDEKGRLLGEVFLGHDLFVNADLVLKGYCKTKTVPPNFEYMKLYRKLEENAKKEKLGIWKELSK
jgi:endonuclease YncB( thermonuclease family)